MSEIRELPTKNNLMNQQGTQRAVMLCVMLALTMFFAACDRNHAAQAPVARKGLVSTGPHVTETVFALGQGSRLIAVSDFCDYPPEAAHLPRIGGYMDPNLEKIAALSPELVIIAGESPKITDFARQRAIPFLNVSMDSLATIDAGIVSLAKTMGCEKEGDALRTKIQAELDAVRTAVKGMPRPKVLLITTRQDHTLNNLYTTSRASFVSELVDCAGGDNIYADAATTYPEASKETIVVKAPEVIIEFHAGEKLDETEQTKFIKDWKQLGSLPAVHDGRIYLILEGYAMRPGPRVGEIARLLAQRLHPDAVIPKP